MRHVTVHYENRRRVGADRIERAVSQRDLAVIADEDVQAQQGDCVDDYVGKAEQLEIGGEQRGEPGNADNRDQREELAQAPAYFSVAAIRRISSGLCSPASGVPGIRCLPMASGPTSTGS